MGTIHVVTAGLLTTVQDLGRWGFQSRGVPVGGAMDLFSHRLANGLVGNAPHDATLEVTLTGPEVVFDDARFAAVAGAEFDVYVNGEPTPHAAPFAVPTGATLRFGARTRGVRAYVAVAGGIDVPEVLGSRSTHMPSPSGGPRAARSSAGTARRPAPRGTPTRSTNCPAGNAQLPRPA